MPLFGRTVDPKEQVDTWTKTLRKTARDMDRQMNKIQREEKKAKQSLKEACKTLAMEIMRSRKTCNKIRLSKVHINSLVRQMRHQLAMLKVSGSLAQSREVMHAMQSLVKMPVFSRTMQDMAKEMSKAGIIEEMMEDTMDVLDEDDQETADAEVEKVLWELTEGKLGKAPRAVEDSLPAARVRLPGARAPVPRSHNSATTTSKATITKSMSIRKNNPSSPVREYALNITDQLSTVKPVSNKIARFQPHVSFTDHFFAGYAVFFTL